MDLLDYVKGVASIVLGMGLCFLAVNSDKPLSIGLAVAAGYWLCLAFEPFRNVSFRSMVIK